MNEYEKLDLAINFLNEGILKDKFKELNANAVKKTLNKYIKEGNYEAAKNYLNENKKYLTDEEYESYKKKIENIKPSSKGSNKKEIELNSVEKKFIAEMYKQIKSLFDSKISSSKYSKIKGKVSIEKANPLMNDPIDIASIITSIEDDGSVDFKPTYDLFDKLTTEIGNQMWKKYKVSSKLTNNASELLLYIYREDIPNNN